MKRAGSTAPSTEAAAGARTVRFSPERFAEAFEKSHQTLWCIAAAILGDRVGADDVLQEAALVALRKLDEFDPDAEGTSFTAWMASIVRFVALNDARRRTRRRAFDVRPESGVSVRAAHGGEGTGGSERPEGEEFDARVSEALGSLGETARVCLLLRTVREMSYGDIATSLGIPQGTAMSHVHRARQALRERLAADAGVESERKDPSVG